MGKVQQGMIGYHAGLSAEAMVASDYARRGFAKVCERWRGEGGEIDLILRDGTGLVFVEVKKSRSFEAAAARLGPRQIARLMRSAEAFAGTQPDGSLTEMRFDVALVDGYGVVRIIENAFAGH